MRLESDRQATVVQLVIGVLTIVGALIVTSYQAGRVVDAVQSVQEGESTLGRKVDKLSDDVEALQISNAIHFPNEAPRRAVP